MGREGRGGGGAGAHCEADKQGHQHNTQLVVPVCPRTCETEACRHKSLFTCSGCHGNLALSQNQEAGTHMLHLAPTA